VTVELRRLTVLVPTRDRPELAARAVRSLPLEDEAISVVVSDNSRFPASRDRLRELLPDAIELTAPPSELEMADHWRWAVNHVLTDDRTSHVSVLTDRMIFRDGAVADVLQRVAAHPECVVSYNHDAVLDADTPVRVFLQEWTGRDFVVDSELLLRLGGKLVYPEALPRLLNCVVPRDVIAAVADRYGEPFGDSAPDYRFAFRCLTVVPAIVYYDRPCLVHYAQGSSTGGTWGRGEQPPDSPTFLLQPAPFPASPVPDLRSVRNSVVHEYTTVRLEAGDPRMPPVNLDRYLALIDKELHEIKDERRYREVEDLLRASGWTTAKRIRYRSRDVASLLRDVRRARRLASRVLWRLRNRGRLQALVGRLERLAGEAVAPVTFATAGEALEYARSNARSPDPEATHLRWLDRDQPQRWPRAAGSR
jgi:hypothetical protein